MTHQDRSVCDPNCHANPKCGLSVTIEDGKITSVGSADYPIPGYDNRICLMGRSRLEYQYHPDRLQKPLRRVGARGEGKWKEISWDEAVSLFVQKQKEIAEKYGSRAVAFSQSTGAFGLLTRGSALRYAGLTEGTSLRPSGVDFGVAKGLEYHFGISAESFFGPGGHAFTDTKNSNLTIIWGCNPAVTRSVDHSALKHARKSGTKLVCIDPVNSETAKLCDEWISLRPGSDGALALSMAHEIIRLELFDRAFLLEHTNMPFLVDQETGQLLKDNDISADGTGEYVVWCSDADAATPLSKALTPKPAVLENLTLANGKTTSVASVYQLTLDLIADYAPEKAEALTGVDAGLITDLAKRFAAACPASIRIGYGVDRWYHADLSGRAIAMLSCLCGYIGIPGGGVSLVDGGRSVPVKGSHFYSADGKLPHFLSLMEADQAVREGTPYPIKMECVSLGNPYNHVKPHRNKMLKEYIGSLEFIAVIDHFMTDTAKLADLVLPACTIFERTDIVVDRFIQLQQRLVEPVGEAKSDFEIFQAFAHAYGIGEYFDKTEEEYIDRMLDGPSPLLKDIDFERLKKEKVIYPWPSDEPFVGLQDRQFPTPSGRIEIYKDNQLDYGTALPVFSEPVEATPKNPLFKKYPLVLLSSHSRYRIHSTFANMETVRRHEPEPVVRIHPQDARDRQIDNGAIVELRNDRGSVKIKCKIDEGLRPGCVLVSEGHWIDQFIEGDPYGLTHDQYSPTTENYAHYDVLVEMAAVRA
ncbi:MAG: molybdopterin-dependent oxidoreductase [Pseudomonadota bacterium]